MLHINKSLSQRLLSGGAWSFMAKAGASFITVALAAIITRVLTPADVGVFFLSYSIIVLLSLFARFGLDQFCVRYIGGELSAHRYVAARKLVNTVILIVFGLSTVVALLLYFLSDSLIVANMLQEQPGFNLKIYLAIWLPVTTFQFLFAEIFRAYHNIKYASIFSGGTIFGGFLPSILFGLVITIGYLTDGSFYLEEILQVLFLIMIVILFIEYEILRKMINRYCELDGDVDTQTISLKEIFYDTYPFLISALSYMLLVHADTIILGSYRPEDEVAIYNATTRIGKLMIIINMIISEVITPIIVELNLNNKRKKLEEILRAASTIAVLSSALFLAIFIVFGDALLALIYGEFYASGISLLLILGSGQLINVWAGLGGYTLNMMGHQKVGMYVALVSSSIAIVACIIVAPTYGAVAIATVIAVTVAIQGIVCTLYVHKFSNIWIYANLFIGVNGIKKLIANAKV